MTQITEQTERCFAKVGSQCTVLVNSTCVGCKFYKPAGCKDWVRRELNDKVVLIEPEEYWK